MADIITTDVLTLDEIKTVIGQEKKAMVIYDVSTGAPNGLDVEVLIRLDASLAAIDASVAQVWTMAETIAQETVDAATAELQGYVYDASTAAETAIATNYTSNFKARVEADGGTMRSIGFTDRVYQANKDLLADTELLFVPEAGMKVTDGKIEKLYNLVGTNDAVQATAENRPYVGGVIAPNEKEKIKHVLGQTGEKSINGTSESFLSTDSWSMVISFSINTSRQYQVIYLNGTSNLLVINYLSQFWMQNGAGIHIIDGAFNFECGKNYTLTISYMNGTGFAVINEDSAAITITPMAIGFSGVGFNNTAFECDATVSYFQVLSSFLSASEIQSLHSFLSTEFPEIETIPVGSQQVATSNLEATVFGGVVIPEVTDNTAWAALTTPAWCHYNNDPALGAVYGKLYNGYAVTALAPYAPTGFHVPSGLEWTQLSESLGGYTVSGGKMKALYGVFNNAFATNESGVSLLGGGRRTESGSFLYIESISHAWLLGNIFIYITSGDAGFAIYPDTPNIGCSLRLFSNTPHLTTDKYDSGFVTTDIGVGNLDVRIPFGCTVESVKVESETGITALSATLLDYNKANGVSLLTGKTVVANTPVNFRVVADQPSGYTDNYVRINGTKAVAAGRFKVTIKITPIQ